MNPIKITRTRDYQATIRSFLEKEEIQAYTMAILSFFALAFFSVFAIRPTLISFFSLQRQIADAKEIEKKLDGKINTLLAAQDEYQKNQQLLALLDVALPPEPMFPELVKKIETLVNDEEATISAFSTRKFSLLEKKGKTPEKTHLNSIDFTAQVDSDFLNNEAFLKKLLNLRRIITLTLLDFRLAEKDTKAKLSSLLDASAFYTGQPNTNNE